MKIDVGVDAYKAVSDKMIELGCNEWESYIVDIWTSNLGGNRIVMHPYEGVLVPDEDWYEGGDVELIGFMPLTNVDVPTMQNIFGEEDEDAFDDALISRKAALDALAEYFHIVTDAQRNAFKEAISKAEVACSGMLCDDIVTCQDCDYSYYVYLGDGTMKLYCEKEESRRGKMMLTSILNELESLRIDTDVECFGDSTGMKQKVCDRANEMLDECIDVVRSHVKEVTNE